MPKFVVVGLASRSLKHPTARNSLIIASDDLAYWNEGLIGKVNVNVESRPVIVHHRYRWCTLLTKDGGSEGFGNMSPNEDTFVFRGVPLVILPASPGAFYDPAAKRLTFS